MMHSILKSATGTSRPLAIIVPHFAIAPRIATRQASLSAIHRGLRRSETAQYGRPQEPRGRISDERRVGGIQDSRGRSQESRGRFQEHRGPAARTAEARTARSLAGSASTRQQHKLKKKLARKAEEKQAEKEDGTGRQTRRKRFLDPESDFGKKSLVYHLRHGQLKDKAENIHLQPHVTAKSFGSKDRDSFHDRNSTWDTIEARHAQQSSTWESQRESKDYTQREANPTRRKKVMMPMTIKYTTAASQFLYGKSVVKAALEQGRRKLYNLYVYGGESRKEAKDKDNALMTRLAKMQGVPVTIVPNDEQRIMDKMSVGRPHNGFVLETSPLPQLPVAALGRLEETPSRLGFHVKRDFQTKEEEAVNGSETFMPRSNDLTPKPFVLLLNEILDPGNLGGLIRTASYLGVDAVAVTNRSSSTLTPVVLKSAAGAAEEVTMFSVDSPETFIEESRKAGWKAYAAVAPPDRKLVRKHGDKFISMEDIEQSRPLSQDPCILVLGNEGHGLARQIKQATDYEVSVPRFVRTSSVDSLNVSVAAGLLCHAFVKQPSPELEPLRKSTSTADSSPVETGVDDEVKQERVVETVF